MTGTARHLTDDDLLTLCLDGADASRSSMKEHVDGCGTCGSRFETLTGFVRAVQDELLADAAEIWSADRLTHQREQIRRRLESAGRLARVIEFPASSRSRRIERPLARVAMRWVAAAAVVGLLVGVGTGALLDHRSHQLATLSAGSAGAGRRGVPARTERRAPTLSEDQFLSDVEAALDAARAPELQALDDFTPRIQEVAVNLK